MLKIYKYRWWFVIGMSVITILLNCYGLKENVDHLFFLFNQEAQLKIYLQHFKKIPTISTSAFQVPLHEMDALHALVGPLEMLHIQFQNDTLTLAFHTDWSGLINFLDKAEDAQQGFLLKDIYCQMRNEKFIIQAKVMLVNKSATPLLVNHVFVPANPFLRVPNLRHLSLQHVPLASLHWVGFFLQDKVPIALVALPDRQLVMLHEHDRLVEESLEIFKITATTIELKDAQKKIILHMD
jgi:hypothetical protein